MILRAALFLFSFAPAVSAAPPSLLQLSLAQAESETLSHSLELKAAASGSAAARARADAQLAPLLPRLTLDGSYRYQTDVAKFSAGPGAPAIPFGDHRATSIGPTLSWILWDEGALWKTWKAQKARARSAEELQRLAAGQALLSARLAYVQVQLAREQLRLFADSAALADAQYEDISKRLRAGAASRIDMLSAHQDALERRKEFLQAQSDLGASLRELLQLTGRVDPLDVSRVIDERVSTSTPAGLPLPTLRLQLDDLADAAPLLAAVETGGLDPDHPRVSSRARDAEAARLAAAAAAAGSWPKIALQARWSEDYPNGPILRSVNQKTVGVSASLPLFDARQSARQAEEQERLADAADLERRLAAEHLARDWEKARAQLASLRARREIDANSISETEELARLVYSAYRAGTSNYLEVQSANLRALQAKAAAARTRAQVLIQLAQLAELSSSGEHEKK